MSANRSPCFPLSRAADPLSSTFHHPHASNHNQTIIAQTNAPTHTSHQAPQSRYRHQSAIQQTARKTLAPNRLLRAGAGSERTEAQVAPRGHKRRVDSDSEDSDGDESDTAMKSERGSTSPTSPSFAFGRAQARDDGHGRNDEGAVKRVKTGNERQFSVSKLLATLDKPQLLILLNSLIDAHPQLHHEIVARIPRPTIATVQPLLATLERRLHDSFPYTKWGPSKDDYSFNRVKPVLTELVDTILDYAAHFTQSEEFPTTTFAYLHIATCVAHRLPQWDNHAHNAVKRELYAKLDRLWRKAVQEAAAKCSEGKIYGQQVVGEWARNLAQHNTESGAAFSAAVDEFQRKLGWIIGIAPPAQQPSAFAGGLFSDAASSHHHHHYMGQQQAAVGQQGMGREW